MSLPPASRCVDGDFARLAQVLANLLNNAAKYTEPGGTIVIAVEGDGADVCCALRDSGIGIPVLGTIFELFAQADRTLDRTQGGLGVGLTLVRRLVSCTAAASACSSEGTDKGSEFVVRLPRRGECRRVAPAAKRRRRHDIAAACWSSTITPMRRISMAALLKRMGQDVRVAHDGPRGARPGARLKPRSCCSTSDCRA